MIVTCQCGFINCNKRTTLVEVLKMGEDMHVGGEEQGLYGKSLHLPLNFAVNQTLL